MTEETMSGQDAEIALMLVLSGTLVCILSVFASRSRIIGAHEGAIV
jgi:hypothetical protein